MSTATSNSFVEAFAQLEKGLGANGQAWFLPVRQKAIARFRELGIPTPKHEDWRFTNLAPIARTGFRPAERATVSAEALAPYLIEGACNLVFVNGFHAPELSSREVPAGVTLGSLAGALNENSPLVAQHYAQHAPYDEHPFTALNTAFARDGAFVRIARSQVVETPLHLVFVSTGTADPTASHPRTLLIAEENSQASVIESYVGVGEGVYLSNAVTEIVAEPAAVVRHYKVQRELETAYHIGLTHMHLARSANVSSVSVAFGAALSRNNVWSLLDGEGSECTLNGLYVMRGQQHADNHLRVEHIKPHCQSWEYYKGILDGASRGVFTGRIVVHKDAQKTDAKQTNMNLLLSAEAQIDTKPQLEIYADDVKCTHGATIGQIDENMLFYLRARGIPENTARGMLIYAFANETLSTIGVEALRAALAKLLLERLPGGRQLEGVL